MEMPGIGDKKNETLPKLEKFGTVTRLMLLFFEKPFLH
jgi:hypothetical protein